MIATTVVLATTAEAVGLPNRSADVVLPQSIEAIFAQAHRAAAAYEASLLGKNEFGDSTMPNVPAGVHFSISGRFQHLYAVPASYEYYKGALTLTLFVSPTIRAMQVSRGGYVGQNAFGARARVRSYLQLEDNLLFREAPAPEQTRQGLAYSMSVPLSPQKAKLLVQNARVIVSGTLDTSGNQRVECSSDGHAPTLDDPTSEARIQLWLPVRVDRIAFVDKASGVVLKEWTGANTPMKSDIEPRDRALSSCS